MKVVQSFKESPNIRRRVYNRLNFLKRIFICLLVMVSVLGMKRIDMVVTNKITGAIKYLITFNYDFAATIQKSPIGVFIRDNLDININKLMKSEPVISENVLTFRLPVTGSIVSLFGNRVHPVLNIERQHNGIDIEAEKGADVTAALPGVVKSISYDNEMGNVIRLDHGGQIETVYGHCDKVYVQVGQQIIRNQVIAAVGDTGITTGSHLHFEVWIEGKTVDPMSFLK